MKQATIYNATIWYQEGNYFLKANRTFVNKKCKEKRAHPMHTSTENKKCKENKIMHTSIKHNALNNKYQKISTKS